MNVPGSSGSLAARKALSARPGPDTSVGPGASSLGALAALGTLVALLVLASPALAVSGRLAWQRHVAGPGGYASFTGLASAPKGGVYTGGWAGLGTGTDYLAARYDAAGRRHWLHTLDFTLHIADIAKAAASDAKGDLVLAGEVDYMSLTQSEAIVKYGPGGKLLWIRHFNDALAGQLTEVAIDARGNVYVATRTASDDIELLKYSSSGTRRWLRTYAGPGAGDDGPAGLALDRAGNVYITGWSYSPTSQFDIVTVKYDPAGQRRWLRRWNGSGNGDDLGSGLAVTPGGAVYVAGNTTGASSGVDAVALKYGAGGRLAWARMFTGAGVLDDQFNDVALLSNGDVAAAGSTTTATSEDVLSVRLSAAGRTKWQKTYDGPDGLADRGTFAAAGPSGTVYVAGSSDGTATSTDMLTLKYGVKGGLRWARRYAGPGTSVDLASRLLVTGRRVYVAGSESTNTGDTATLLSYLP